MNFTPAQQRIITDLRAHFGIDPAEISLDESGELFIHFDALQSLRLKLAPDIYEIGTTAHSYDREAQIVTAHGSVTLQDGRRCTAVKSAEVGEIVNGKPIETMIQAANFADARCARALLRMVSFDPIKEFQNFLIGNQTERETAPLPQAELDRRYIHKVRDDRDMDNETYRTHLRYATNHQFNTTQGMDEVTMSKVALYFRGIEAAAQMQNRRAA